MRFAILEQAPFVVPDPKRRLGGRGVWVEAKHECLKNACKSGFSRLAKRPLRPKFDDVLQLLEAGLEARLCDMLGGGRRAGLVHFGTDDTRQRVKAGDVPLIALAMDASPRHRGVVIGEDAPPHVVVLDKTRLGAIFARDEVAVLSVMDNDLAKSVQQVAEQLNALCGNKTPSGEQAEQNTLDAHGFEKAQARTVSTASKNDAGDETEA